MTDLITKFLECQRKANRQRQVDDAMMRRYIGEMETQESVYLSER